MANTLITPTFVTKDTAVQFKNSLKLIGNFDRSYDDIFEGDNGTDSKIGYVIQVRKEQRWIPVEGQQLVVQPILNQTTPITVNHQFHIGMAWSSADDKMLVEEVQDRYTRPAGKSLANKWDVVAGAEVYKQIYNSVGTPGSPISSNQSITDAVAKLRGLGVDDDLIAVVTPQLQSNLMNANMALFSNRSKRDSDYENGTFSGPALGVDLWAYDPNLPTHTTGTFTASTPVVAGANQTGSTLAISGMGTYALKAGDVFTIDGNYGTNSISFAETPELQQYVLLADVSGSSTATLSISPSIVTSGSLQTVSASPTNGAAINFMGSTGTVAATMAATRSKQSLVFNKKAFAFVMVDLPADLPGAKVKRVSDRETGISLRWAEQWNIQTDQLPRRVDTLGGVACVEPAFALRVWS